MLFTTAETACDRAVGMGALLIQNTDSAEESEARARKRKRLKTEALTIVVPLLTGFI
jgi:hypothetical protein